MSLMSTAFREPKANLAYAEMALSTVFGSLCLAEAQFESVNASDKSLREEVAGLQSNHTVSTINVSLQFLAIVALAYS